MIRPIILTSILVKEGKRYLLVQEKTDKIMLGVNTHTKNKWTIPHGRADQGETVEQAARREFLEETGGETEILRLGVVAFGCYGKSIGMLCFIFQGRGFKKIRERWVDEIKAVDWFTRIKINRLVEDDQIRDRMPILKIIESIETHPETQMIEWKLPKEPQEVLRRINAR